MKRNKLTKAFALVLALSLASCQRVYTSSTSAPTSSSTSTSSSSSSLSIASSSSAEEISSPETPDSSSSEDSSSSAEEVIDPDVNTLLKNARAGISYYDRTHIDGYNTSSGVQVSSSNRYSRIDRNDDYFTYQRLSGEHGDTIQGMTYSLYRGNAVYNGTTYINAALSNLYNIDGSIAYYFHYSNYYSKYGNPFNLISDADLYFNYAEKTATIYNSRAIQNFMTLMSIAFDYSSFTSFTEPLVLHYDPVENIFTSAEIGGFEYENSSYGITYHYTYTVEFLSEYDHSNYYVATSSLGETEDSLALQAAMTKTRETLTANHDYTLTVSSDDSETFPTYHKYMDDGKVLHSDVASYDSYHAEAEIVNTDYVNTGDAYLRMYAPTTVDMDPYLYELTSYSLDTTEVETTYDSISANLFKKGDTLDDGTVLYELVTPRILNNVGIYETACTPYYIYSYVYSVLDEYVSTVESYISNLEYKVKDGMYVGYRATLCYSGETHTIDYDMTDFGTTEVPSKIMTAGDKLSVLYRAFSEKNLGNVTISYSDPATGYPIKIEAIADGTYKGGKVRVSMSDTPVIYMELVDADSTYLTWNQYTLDLTTNTWSMTRRGTKQSIALLLSDLLNLPYGLKARLYSYILNVNDDVTTATVALSSTADPQFTLTLDEDSRVTTLVNTAFVSPIQTSTSSSTATNTTFTFSNYGEIESITLPEV